VGAVVRVADFGGIRPSRSSGNPARGGRHRGVLRGGSASALRVGPHRGTDRRHRWGLSGLTNWLSVPSLRRRWRTLQMSRC